VFKNSVAKILIIVSFFKIMLVKDFSDIFYPQFFSRFFSTFPQTPVAHLLTLCITSVCRGTPVENHCLTGFQNGEMFHKSG
jgi:hypothetical protein